MAETIQATDPSTAAFNSTDRYSNRCVVPFAHTVVAAYLFTLNTVTTGTVEIQLKKVDVGDARGGANVGTKLQNSDIDAATSVNKKFTLTLSADDKGVSPAFRQYFVVSTGTNSADRFDEPTLVLEVERV